MAGEYLRARGIDLDAEMARIQDETTLTDDEHVMKAGAPSPVKAVNIFRNVSLPHTSANSRWDVATDNGRISDIKMTAAKDGDDPASATRIDGHGALLAPSLCHPHVHIDKAYLLSHPKYAHLQVEEGDFSEAMTLTGKAKADFQEWDLLERGQRVIDESVKAGVTHIRAFVEIDAGVGMKCLDAGVKLKRKAEQEGKCILQLCAFAQLPLFTSSQGDEAGSVIRKLMQDAALRHEINVIGSTPYVESGDQQMRKNIEWMIDLSIEQDLHLDFHLDYNLEISSEPMVWHVIKMLKVKAWKEKTTHKTIVLGHCTRLTLFDADEWRRLKDEIGDLPISFVGLPTSDLFMMRTPDQVRGTLDVPTLIKEYGFNACIGINNIGNAFTPYGSCDPLTLACNGIGVYHAGTKQDAELLYECISSRARQAIGLESLPAQGERHGNLEIKSGDKADLVLFGVEEVDWRTRKTVAEAVYLYDQCQNRKAYLNRALISASK